MVLQRNMLALAGFSALMSMASSPALAGYPGCNGNACKDYRTYRVSSNCLGASNIGSQIIRLEYGIYVLTLQPGEQEPFKLLGSPPCISDFGPGVNVSANYTSGKPDASKKGVWRKKSK